MTLPRRDGRRRWTALAAAGALTCALGVGVLAGLAADMGASAVCDPAGPASSPIESLAKASGEKKDSVDGDGFPEVDWEKWSATGADVVGWVTVKGTPIDYPIVLAPASNPEKYLHASASGSWSAYGTPYLDASCSETGLTGSANAVVYGHHMNDGTMFSAFADFYDGGYAAEHSPILLQTPSAKYKLTPVRVERVDAATSTLDTSTKVEGLRHCVTFVTCSYSTWANERTLVHCSLEKVG